MRRRIENLRRMRKRRVGVTARSRQNVGNRETGALQFATEMAAPLEMRTPAGTGSETAKRVRMEAWQQGAQEVNEQRNNSENNPRIGEGWETGEAARLGRA